MHTIYITYIFGEANHPLKKNQITLHTFLCLHFLSAWVNTKYIYVVRCDSTVLHKYILFIWDVPHCENQRNNESVTPAFISEEIGMFNVISEMDACTTLFLSVAFCLAPKSILVLFPPFTFLFHSYRFLCLASSKKNCTQLPARLHPSFMIKSNQISVSSSCFLFITQTNTSPLFLCAKNIKTWSLSFFVSIKALSLSLSTWDMLQPRKIKGLISRIELCRCTHF